FFLARSRALRALYSFPTRRYSDLCEIIMSRGVPSRIGVTKKPRQVRKTSRLPLTTPGRLSGRNTSVNAARGRAPRLAAALRWSRSEEHTSELQPRGHLVCRLLLEK